MDGDASPLLNAKATPLSSSPARRPYDGVEFKWGNLSIRPAELKQEILFSLLLITYGLFTYFGAKVNRSHAQAWFEANAPTFKEEFSTFGMTEGQLFTDDGDDEYVAFGTGRRGVEGVQVNLRTGGGNDPLYKLYTLARSVADFSFDSGANKIVRTVFQALR
jgi:hypothetical protein